MAIGTNPGGGTLSGTTTVVAAAGVATFSNLSIDKAGTGYTLSATSTPLTGATSAAFTISPAAASKLAFTVQPTNTVAGVAVAPAVQVTVRDAFDNTVTGSSATITLAIGTNPGGGALSGTTTLAAVSGVATFSNLSIDKTGTGYTLTAASAGLTGATSSAFTITPAAAARLAFTVQPSDSTAGVAIAPAVRVTVRDAFDNTVTGSTASITVAIGTNPGGGTLSGIATVAASGGVATFNLSIDKSGVGYTLTAASGALTGATSTPFDIRPAAPNRLAYITPPRTIVAGTCSLALTVEVRDVFSNASPATSPITVTLASSSTAGVFFLDSGCGAQSATATVATGATSVSFFYKDTKAGSPSVTASAAGLTSATQGLTVSPAAAVKIAFLTAPQVLTAGSCSAVVTVQLQDNFGNASSLGTDTALTLQSTSAGATFYTTAGCGTTAVTGVNITAGNTLASFFFKDTVAGTPTLRVSSAVTTTGTQVETINPGPPVKLAFITPPQTHTVGACSEIATVQVQDNLGNPVNLPVTRTVNLASTSTGNAFFSSTDPVCGGAPITSVDIAAGTSSASFYFLDTVVGTPTLTASVSGAPALTAATQVENIQATGVASKLAFVGAPQTLPAGFCAAFTVEAEDSFGNAVQGARTVSLSSNSVGGAFFTTTDCSGAQVPSVDIAFTDSSVTFYYRDTMAGGPTLTVASTGLTNATQTETVLAGAPSALAFATPPQTLPAGGCSAIITIETRDSFGNPSDVAGATAVGLATSSTGGLFYTDSACATAAITTVNISAGSQTASFYYRDTRAGAPTLTASRAGLTSGTQVETVLAGARNKLAFTTAPQALVAGDCSSVTTVQFQDAFGNPVPVTAPTVVTFTSSSTAGAFYAGNDPVCAAAPITSRTVPAGASTLNFFFVDTQAGAPTLRASSSGLTDATQVETIVAAPASKLGYVTAPQTITAGVCSAAVTVEARDTFDNPSSVATATTVVLATTAGTSGSFYANPTCTGAPVPSVSIPAAGTSATFYYRDTAVGTPTLTISNPGLASGTQVETIVPAALSQLAFTTPPQVLVAGACSAVATVETRDAFGNASTVTAATTLSLASSSATTTFYFDSGCSAAVTSVTVPAGSGTASFYFHDTAAGTATVTVSATGLTSATQLETFNAGAPVKLGFGNPPRTVAAGACSAAVIVQAQDASGNPAALPAPGKTVTLASSSTAGTFYANAACSGAAINGVSIAGGTSSSTVYYRDTRVGTPSITLTEAALGSASQTETITPAAVAKLAFLTPAQTVTAGTCSAVTTVQSRDSFDNPSDAAAAISVGLTSSSTGGRFYSDSGCTNAVTSVSIASGTRTASFYFQDNQAGSPTLTAAAAGLTAATQVETIVPAAPVKLAFSTPSRQAGAGVCSPILTVETRDSLNNASPVASSVPINLSSTSTTVAFFSDPLCAVQVSGSISLVSGSSAVSFYFRDATAGSQTLTAGATGFTSASQVETVVAAGAPRALAFITPPRTVDANACSPVVMVDTQDQNGVTSPVTSAVTVALTSAASTLSFYSDPSCTARITQQTIASGQFRVIMYLKGSNARPTTITAADQAAVLTSATQNVNVACPAVGTATCDDADLCNGRETCQAGACTPAAPLTCDDGNRCTMDSCQAASGCHNDPVPDPTCCVPPAIVQDANPNAAVGVRYRYSSTSGGARVSLGTGPIAWSLCDSPPSGFRIDATTGSVDWTPAAAGTANVCVAARGTCGQFEYRFTVAVAPATPAMPVAKLTLTPNTAGVGASFTADGLLSTVQPLYGMELDFGDGSPLVSGAQVTHAYLKAGSYPVRLRVYDSVGQFAEDKQTFKVSDAACGSPPEVRIAAPQTTGQDRLTVSFTTTYDGSDPGAVYRWDLGDGTTATGPSVTHDYTTGHYVARVQVVSAEGCTSVDAVEIGVDGAGNRAPYCRVGLTPAAGPAPLPVTITGTFGDADGAVASATWLFSDGITQDATRYNGAAFRTISNPGKLGVTLSVVDDRGLTCRASAEAEAGNDADLLPPEIVTTPKLTAVCGEPYTYGDDGIARATGSRPITWSLGQGNPAVGVPSGMTIDANGQIQWVPRKKATQERVTVVAENGAGVAQQDFVVDVQCTNEDPFVDCGCSSGAEAAPLALLLLASLARRRRRWSVQPSRGEDH